MIFKELLNHFNINESFPDYLLDESFNEVFLGGDLSIKDNCYKIIIKTRQNVLHQMIIKPKDEYPVVILSELPNGLLNGMKFGLTKNDVKYINGL